MDGVGGLTDRYLQLRSEVLLEVLDVTLRLQNSLQSILKRKSYLRERKDHTENFTGVNYTLPSGIVVEVKDLRDFINRPSSEGSVPQHQIGRAHV